MHRCHHCSPLKTFCSICGRGKYISTKLCQYVTSLYPNIFANFGGFVLIFNKMAFIFQGVLIIFNVSGFEFHQVKLTARLYEAVIGTATSVFL